MANRNEDPILYICYQEEHVVRCCYGIRAINLVDLLSCSCKYDEDSREIIQCNRCQSRRRESGDSDPSGDLRVLAHLCGTRREVPNYMGCGVFGSQIIFLGGLEPPPLYPKGPQRVHSNRVFVFETETAADHGSKSIQQMDESSNLTKFQHGKVNPWLVELNGYLYAFSFCSIPYPPIRRSEANPTILRSEVYRRGSQQWETRKHCRNLRNLSFSGTGKTFFNGAITCGDKVLVSKQRPSGPILCFDPQLNSWKPSPCFSESFPFGSGEGLVLDWKDCGGRNCNEKVTFSLYRDCDIIVRRLVLANEDGLDACMEEVQFLGITSLLANLMLIRRRGYSTHKFVHLGDGKVCFVKAKGFHYSKQLMRIETVRLLFIIFKFQFDDSGAFSSEILATRTFDYKTHCVGSDYPHLISCFVR